MPSTNDPGRSALVAVLIAAAVVSAGCSAPAEAPSMPERMPADFPGLGDCREMFAEADARIDAAGVRHAAYYRVPGFPYLRTDRVLASFRNEVDGIDDVGTWVRRMRELDYEARFYELRNLDIPDQDRANLHTDLYRCGRGLAFVDLENDANLDYLREVAVPPPEHSGPARRYGVTSLARPLLGAYVRHRQAEVRETFAQPLAPDGAKLRYWQATDTRQRALAPDDFDEVLADPLGFPGMIGSAWQALAEMHAPAIWVDTASVAGAPGAPTWRDGVPVVDSTDPTVYYQAGFTRMGEQRLVQISYVLFFGSADADGASAMDSLVWRVTLDRDAAPLLYDSIPASGWPHTVFPLQGLEPRAVTASGDPVLAPQSSVPERRPVLRVGGSPAALQRVASREQANPDRVGRYRLENYDALYTLPVAGGGTRSLFSPAGTIAGSGGGFAPWARLAGIPEPGALRQLGRLPTGFVGDGQFDDPYLLERLFRLPEAVASAR